MALGTSKKKAPTAAALKKENEALKLELEDLKAKLDAAEAAAAAVPKTVVVESGAEKDLNRLRAAVKRVCDHHPGVKEHVRAAGVLGLL